MIDSNLRPPAIPLVTHTPFFSTWSTSDKLTDSWPSHWAGGTTAMFGMISIDGKVYRWMGPEAIKVPVIEQKSVTITATRSIYEFEGAGIRFTVTFLSPLLPDDFDKLSMPVTYVMTEARATDGKAHQVKVYMDASAEWCVSETSQSVVAGHPKSQFCQLMSFQSKDQPALERSGDRVQAGWGTFYLGAMKMAKGEEDTVITSHGKARSAFANEGVLPKSDDLRFPRPASDDWPVMAAVIDMNEVSGSEGKAQFILAYDEGFSIEYFHRKLRPYWNRNERGFADLLDSTVAQSDAIRAECEAFDKKVEADLAQSGGPEYARLGVLAYRQCLAGHGLVADINGDALMFSKENTSNGCMATVDVTFPASPFFLYFNPKLLEAQLRPVMEYSSMQRWHFPFAPHDLGTYPKSNGQVYGGGESNEENQMPVEESANMILMVAACARHEGGMQFAAKYKAVLDKWADYLLAKGLDPENQLCTDDFTGHLAHNANLSLKAILAIGAYAEVCDGLKDAARAKKLGDAAKDLAKKWMTMAADGDHTKLAFDRPGTWSLKYNLVWQKILGLKLFPDSLAKSELAFYRSKQNAYGVPLDNRATFTKTDWLFWAAALSDSNEEFEGFIRPVLKMTNETKSRVPFSDWYDTKDARTMGMYARTVIGGIFVRQLVAPKGN